MKRTKKKSGPSEIRIPRELDAASAPETHATLVAALDAATDASPLSIELDGDPDATVWPLALQLLSSARRSGPSGRIGFGNSATAALETLAPPEGDPR